MAQLFGVLIAVVGALIWWAVQSSRNEAHRRAQQTFVPPPQGPFCPQCGTPGYWNGQHQLWGCTRCQQWIQTAQPANPNALPMMPPVVGGPDRR